MQNTPPVESKRSAAEEMPPQALRNLSLTILTTVDAVAVFHQSAISAASEAVAASSQELVLIAKVVDGISEQANILALKAASESARVGESGKGVAALADEMRLLARRIAEAAAAVSESVESAIARHAKGTEYSAYVACGLDELAGDARKIADVVAQLGTKASAAADSPAAGISPPRPSILPSALCACCE